MTRRALVLLGSPKSRERSSSAHLARRIADRLEAGGWSIDWIHLLEAMASDDSKQRMLSAADASDLLLLAAPLYVDSLPAPAIGALEAILEHQETGGSSDASFCTVLNCGFIEPSHNDTAQRICRRFCSQAGYKWRGALSIGGAGQLTARVRRLLLDAGDALAQGDRIPLAVERDLHRLVIPRALYILGGNAMWRRVARKRFGVSRSGIRACPYEPAANSTDQS